MLAALIAFQNKRARVQPQPRLPTIKIDRGGGGGQLWSRSYDVVDVIAAAAAFPENPNESDFDHTVRRLRWIAEALPRVKAEREQREAYAFMAGAQLGASAEREAQTERAKAEQAARVRELTAAIADKLSLEQMIQIVDEFRKPPVRALEISRGQRGGPAGSGVVLAIGLVVGTLLGVAITGKRGKRRRG